MATARRLGRIQTRFLPGDPELPARTVAIALGVGAIQLLGSIGASRGQPDREPLDAIAVVLLIAGPAALLFRDRFPRATLWTVVAATLTYMILGYAYGPVILSPLVAAYYTITSGRRLTAWAGAGVLYAGHMGYRWAFDEPPGWAESLVVAGWMLVALVAFEAARAYQERAGERRRATAEETRRRESDERLQIAQDLHDVLAHHISLVNVQAGVGLHLMERKPEQARIALEAIEQASREAMGELRTVLDLLRRDGDSAPRSPAPSLARLDALTSQAAAAGLELRIEREDGALPVSAAVDAAAYRVVQEAITNVIRHASATVATVRLASRDGRLEISVEDNGVGGAASPAAGSGIRGMRERVQALGGTFEASAGAGGGFIVRASFPVEGPA